MEITTEQIIIPNEEINVLNLKLKDIELYERCALRASQKYNNKDEYINTINNDLNDVKREKLDIRSRISSISICKVQSEKIQEPNNHQKHLEECERYLHIEIKIREAAQRMAKKYSGNQLKYVQREIKECDDNIHFYENQINRIKHLLKHQKDQITNKLDKVEQQKEIEFREMIGRRNIENAIFRGCLRAIEASVDKKESLTNYRESYHKLHIYEQVLTLIKENSPNFTIPTEECSTSCLSVSGSLHIYLKGSTTVPESFSDDIITCAFEKGFDASSLVVFPTSQQSKIKKHSTSDTTVESKCVIKIDNKPLFETSYGPINENSWKEDIYLNLNKSKQIEFQIYVNICVPDTDRYVWVLSCLSFLKLEELFDEKNKHLELKLYPKGTLYLDIKLENKVLKKGLNRQKPVFSMKKGQEIMRSTEMGIDFSLWSRLVCHKNNILFKTKTVLTSALPKIKKRSKGIEKTNHRHQKYNRKRSGLTCVDSVVDPEQSSKFRLSQFRLISVLGSGGFGKVFLVQYQINSKYYALKAIVKRQNFKVHDIISEKEIMQSICGNHPFLINLMASFHTMEHVIFVMEYAHGSDLMTFYIKYDTFREDYALFYGSCVLLGLEFLHSRNIIYRDLKLENLMISKDGYLKMVDFGLAKGNMDCETCTSTFCGTLEFIAPEMLICDNYTRAIDWWQLGVLIYMMLAGHGPFTGDTDEEMMKSIEENDIAYDFSNSALAMITLKQLLNRDPVKRIGSSSNDANDVKKLQFFSSMNFNDLLEKKLKPPFIPAIVYDEDVSNFSDEFTKEKPVLPRLTETEHLKYLTRDCLVDFEFCSDLL